VIEPRASDALASFVPDTVRLALAATQRLPTVAQDERFSAALLLIDITGFTVLTSSFAQRGPAGTEQLSRSLNDYLGRIIDLVVDHGGDITKILGDALLPVWPARDEDLATATRRAIGCGLAIASKLNNVQVEQGVRLSVKVGVCAGDVIAAQVGGQDQRWMFLVVGDAVAQLSPLESHLQTGGVVLSPRAWPLVAASSVGEPLEGGHVRLLVARNTPEPRRRPPSRLSPTEQSLVRAFVPIVCLDRLDAGQAEWLAELRITTVLFISVRGVDSRTADVVSHLQHVTEIAQQAFGRYQGWLKEITMDEKGTTIVSAFGVPPFTHEDDPVRAVQAALAIQNDLRMLDLGAGIGITTGPAFCGPVGNATRRDFAVLGQHVNLASRFAQAAAADAILCDASTYEGARLGVAFERLPAFLLKGMSAPVDAYRVHAPAVTGRPPASIIDRADALAAISARLDKLASGSGGVVVVEGEAGIGKSRIVAECVERARALGVRCVIGTGEAIERATPYHAWRAVFERLFDLENVRDAETRRSLMLARLRAAGESDRLAPLLDPVLPLGIADNEVTAQMTGVVRAENARELLTRLLAREATAAPLMVVLEDAHLLDSASSLLAALAHRQIPSLFLLIAMRRLAADSGSAPISALREEATVFPLEALARKDALDLACRRIGAVTLAEPIAALVQERAEGNPLFIEQLTYAMRDVGKIVIDDGICRAAPGAEDLDAVIPGTVERVITSRIDQLPAAVALTLKVASVIGKRFSLRTLRDIYPLAIDEQTLLDHLDTLVRLDLVRVEPAMREPAYEFTHVIAQEVTYNLMLGAQSEQLHQRLASWYELVHADDLSPLHAFLAYHWRRAGAPSRAVDHLELAGMRALRNFANQEAIDFLAEAISLEREAGLDVAGSRRSRWELGVGEAYVHLSKYREGREHLDAGLRLMGRRVPTSARQQVQWLLGQIVVQIFRRVGLIRQVRTSTREALDILVIELRAFERLAEASYYGAETLLTLYCVIHILNAAETSGIAAEIARGYAGTGALFGFVPLPSIADWYVQRALDRLRGVDDLTTHEVVEVVVGFYYVGAARWDRAKERFRRVLEIARPMGDRRRLDDALANLMEIEWFRGSFRSGAELADELQASASGRQDRRFEGEALAAKAMCLLQLGNSGEAMKDLTALTAIVTNAADITIELRLKLFALLAITHLARGERQQALAASEDAMRLTEHGRPTYYGSYLGYLGPADVYLSLWEEGSASQHVQAQAREAVKRLRKYAEVFPMGRPRSWTAHGRYLWLTGNRRRALTSWRRAVTAAVELSMPLEQGLAHYEIGRHLDPSDPEGSVQLARAREIFGSLGASHVLAAADAAASGRVR